MGWWPFAGRTRKDSNVDQRIHVKGTKVWLQELQEICERNFDSPEEAKRLIRQMQVEWKDAAERGDLDQELSAGLERRAFHLLKSDVKEWSDLLDDIEFWRPGWRSER